MESRDTVAPGGPASRIDEERLVAELRSGDDAAYETLVRVHGPRLLATARKLLGSDDDARDALQDAFLSAFRAIDRFERGSLLSTWLHRIVVNAALMKLRKRRRSHEVSVEDLLPKFQDDGHQADPAVEWRDLPPELAEAAEERAMVRRSIDRLPDAYRTILLLRDIEGLDTAETARALGENENTVKVRLHRARQALRALMDPYMRGGEA